MYRPEDPKAPRYPVFEKVNGRIVPWLSAKGALAIIAACVLAGMFIHLSASWTRTVDVALADGDHADEVAHLERVRDVATYDEVEAELALLADSTGAPREDLTDEERERYYELVGERAIAMRTVAVLVSSDLAELRAEAQELGITSSTTDAELAELIPPTRPEERRVIAAPLAILIAGIIVIAGAALFIEPREGENLYRLIREDKEFRSKQHEYLYAHRTGSF